jgi:plasmid maintenance system antidote protein VapI
LKQLHTDADRSVVTDAENLWLQMQKSKDLWLQSRLQKSKEANCEVDARV